MIVVATLQAHDGREGDLEQVLAHTVGPARSEEGCLVYALHRVSNNPGRFVLIEGWESQTAYDAHMQSDHTATLVAALGDILSEPPTIEQCEPLEAGDASKGEVTQALN